MARYGAVFIAVCGILFSTSTPVNAAKAGRKAGVIAKYVFINFLFAAADYESAHAVQHRGGCLESNPAFGQFPSRARFYSEGLAIDAGTELVGWFLHRKHLPIWQAPFAVVAAWHAEGTVSNFRCNAR